MVSVYKIFDVHVEIYDIPDMDETEAASYIEFVEKEKGMKLTKLEIAPAGSDEVALTYTCKGEKFERIRRITGYLVGTIDRWNNAKQAEEHDRVKHIRV